MTQLCLWDSLGSQLQAAWPRANVSEGCASHLLQKLVPWRAPLHFQRPPGAVVRQHLPFPALSCKARASWSALPCANPLHRSTAVLFAGFPGLGLGWLGNARLLRAALRVAVGGQLPFGNTESSPASPTLLGAECSSPPPACHSTCS